MLKKKNIYWNKWTFSESRRPCWEWACLSNQKCWYAFKGGKSYKPQLVNTHSGYQKTEVSIWMTRVETIWWIIFDSRNHAHENSYSCLGNRPCSLLQWATHKNQNSNEAMTWLICCVFFFDFSGGKRTGHIPYRESKLTRILQSSLGGNARTAIICTLSPALSHVEQSRNTLSFATSAKEVTNTTRVNVVRQFTEILDLFSTVQFHVDLLSYLGFLSFMYYPFVTWKFRLTWGDIHWSGCNRPTTG